MPGVVAAFLGVVVNAAVVWTALHVPRRQERAASKAADEATAQAAEACEIALSAVTRLYDWLQPIANSGRLDGAKLSGHARTIDASIMTLELMLQRTTAADVLDLVGRTLIVLRTVRDDLSAMGQQPLHEEPYEAGSRLHRRLHTLLNPIDSMSERVTLRIDAGSLRHAYTGADAQRRAAVARWFAHRRMMRRGDVKSEPS
ncbi:hypothetical protein [Phenylobacterium sp.]|uniref:hypothetical protein n=1 Tax=Phenylobacterium sp. TaxID=1871053 RepID=UPI002811BD1C|nr:hypothetical protein [Phenylobacterium sp.]